MLEMIVGGLGFDERTGQPILVLSDREKRRALPIWIGQAEAIAISNGLEKVTGGRPLTHDLMLNVIEELGYEVERVEITALENHAYKASLNLVSRTRTQKKKKSMDARPSDAIAIAVRANVPIFAAEALIKEGSIFIDEETEERDAEEFKKFVETVNASDFKLDNFDAQLEEEEN